MDLKALRQRVTTLEKLLNENHIHEATLANAIRQEVIGLRELVGEDEAEVELQEPAPAKPSRKRG